MHGATIKMDLKGLRLGIDTIFLRLIFILDTFHRLLSVESHYIRLVAHTSAQLFEHNTETSNSQIHGAFFEYLHHRLVLNTKSEAWR
jgi:hypothetical protein